MLHVNLIDINVSGAVGTFVNRGCRFELESSLLIYFEVACEIVLFKAFPITLKIGRIGFYAVTKQCVQILK